MNRRTLLRVVLPLAFAVACTATTGPSHDAPIAGAYVLTTANSLAVPATLDSVERTQPPTQIYWQIMVDGTFLLVSDTSGVLALTYRAFLKVPDVPDPLLGESRMSGVPVRIKRMGSTISLTYTTIHEAICGRALDALREYTDTAIVAGKTLVWRRRALSCWPAMVLEFQRP